MMTIKGRKLALLLLLVVALEILLFAGSDAKPWWRRRRRRTCSSSRPSSHWVNNWRQNFNVRCPNSYSISVWQSQYKSCLGDRIHYFKCKRGPFQYQDKHCSTTHYVNDYNKALIFRCPHNGVIAGVASTYSANTRDRRFFFRCCHRYGYIAHTCKYTALQNSWDKPLRYVVPYGYYLVGALSYHHNRKEDRIWKFQICTYSRKG
ncbi:PREDICTED: hemagglutinin/amebocyte aggregation factor-like isoform X3 [Acropora digitifera]|uniref:hemagglutinin/amebocyte aggregation factor-like isoform X3 n=1 Tax=Acropora digitifera TaxID=70779 RepID=UPI00077B1A03|nr:PREDICTED: hemagglutinin/amebocyte aggregation factor-like isoform X3 [Acropora digitifera]